MYYGVPSRWTGDGSNSVTPETFLGPGPTGSRWNASDLPAQPTRVPGSVILFLGDLHFIGSGDRVRVGPGSGSVGTADDERDLVQCLEHLADGITHVILLGDVYDAFVEYRHLVPRGPVRLLGQLARLADRGVEVTYVVGNHDPWHRTFVTEDLGFRLIRHTETRLLDGLRVHLGHGDQEEHPGRRWARWLTRHPGSLRLFTAVLPGDAGQGLALAVSRRIRRSPGVATTAERLRAHARRVLESGDVDVVAFGHSHEPTMDTFSGGIYLNPGFWPASRIIGRIVDGRPELCRWTDGALEVITTGAGLP